MGFFSDLKEDMSQAVNELMPEEELDHAVCYSRIVYDFDSVYQYPQTGQKGLKSISHGGNSLYGAG